MKAAILRVLSRPTGIGAITISDPRVLAGDIAPPAVPGHGAAGIVERVGPDARDVRPGDPVIACLPCRCGRCRRCRGGGTRRRMTPEAMRGTGAPPRRERDGRACGGFVSIGGFAEPIPVYDGARVAVRGMRFGRARPVACGVGTGSGAASRTAGVRHGGAPDMFAIRARLRAEEAK